MQKCNGNCCCCRNSSSRRNVSKGFTPIKSVPVILIEAITKYQGMERLDQVRNIIGNVYKNKINTINKGGRPLLILAVESDDDLVNAAIVEILINAGADVNITDDSRIPLTALAYALLYKSSNINTIGTLLKNGADIKTTDYKLLLQDTHKHLLDLFIKYGVLKISSGEKDSLLMQAVKNNTKEDIVKKLIDNGANVNDVGSDGSSILMAQLKVIVASNFDVTLLLISSGADKYFVNESKSCTILMCLAELEDSKAMEYTCKYIDECEPSYIKKTTVDERNALDFALTNRANNVKVIEKLLEHIKDRDINELLAYKPFYYTYEKLQVFLRAGFKIDMDEIPFHLEILIKNSRCDRQFELIKYLLETDPDAIRLYPECLIDAIDNDRNNYQIIHLLLRSGADYKYMRETTRRSQSFLSRLNFNKPEHMKIWNVIVELVQEKVTD